MSTGDARSLLLVVGVGRSGTSLFSGIVGQLGFHIPQPEVKADSTNPRGFGEPRWVVDFHQRLLRERRIGVNDARPSAWETTHAAAQDPAVVAELREWLAGQFAQASAIVVKDPRTGWFLPLWTRCAAELGVPVSFVSMVRHPAEVVTSARRSYGTSLTEASRTAAWINGMLETERITRGARRAFVRYEDLLADWTREINRTGELVDVALLQGVDAERFPEADGFVDPTLHRNRVRWDELDVPAAVREMAEDVWERFESLAAPGGDTGERQAALDEARTAYGVLYAEAEAIAQSSIVAQKPRKGGADKPTAAAAPRPGLKVQLARRIPAPYRRRLRHAVSALRGSR
jgi:hypothetical protein